MKKIIFPLLLIIASVSSLCLAEDQVRQATATFTSTATSTQPLIIQLIQPAQQKTFWETAGPYITSIVAALVTLLVAAVGALITWQRGKMDAKHGFAAEILKFRLRQIEEFYAPVLLNLEQSRIVYEKLIWTIKRENKIPLKDFRLLDHIQEFKDEKALYPLIQRVLEIGNRITTTITEKSGLIEGGVTSIFSEYQAHNAILQAAHDRPLSEVQKDGWQEFGYYPRLLNREIREGYKVVLAHLESYAEAGDQIIHQVLKDKPADIGKHRKQLLENLRFYEKHAPEYASKYDLFDLSEARNKFVSCLDSPKYPRGSSAGHVRGKILEAGCGTGRDALAFLRIGYAVVGVDASPQMLREWRRKVRSAVENPESEAMRAAAKDSDWRELTFDELEFRSEFDGVWAAASLLHIPNSQLVPTLERLVQSVRSNGVVYLSFKFGKGENIYDSRFYCNQNRSSLKKVLKGISNIKEEGIWLSDSAGKALLTRAEVRANLSGRLGMYDKSLWINVILRRIKS